MSWVRERELAFACNEACTCGNGQTGNDYIGAGAECVLSLPLLFEVASYLQVITVLQYSIRQSEFLDLQPTVNSTRGLRAVYSLWYLQQPLILFILGRGAH